MLTENSLLEVVAVSSAAESRNSRNCAVLGFHRMNDYNSDRLSAARGQAANPNQILPLVSTSSFIQLQVIVLRLFKKETTDFVVTEVAAEGFTMKLPDK